MTRSPVVSSRTFDLRVPDLATSDLTGDTVHEVVARGKHILMRFGGGSPCVATCAWTARGTWWQPAGVRSVIPSTWCAPGSAMPPGFATGYRVHDLRIVATANEHELVGHLGPDLPRRRLDVDEVLRRLNAQPDTPIGEALARSAQPGRHRQSLQVRDACSSSGSVRGRAPPTLPTYADSSRRHSG